MNRREAIAGMIGAVGAASVGATAQQSAQVRFFATGPAKWTLPTSRGGKTIVTFFRHGVAMGRYEGQSESQGKPLEILFRENGYRFA